MIFFSAFGDIIIEESFNNKKGKGIGHNKKTGKKMKESFTNTQESFTNTQESFTNTQESFANTQESFTNTQESFTNVRIPLKNAGYFSNYMFNTNDERYKILSGEKGSDDERTRLIDEYFYYLIPNSDREKEIVKAIPKTYFTNGNNKILHNFTNSQLTILYNIPDFLSSDKKRYIADSMATYL